MYEDVHSESAYGDFPSAQWLRLGAPNGGGSGSTRQGTRSYRPQLKILHATMKTDDPCAASKTQHSQINKYLKKKKKSAHGGEKSGSFNDQRQTKFCFV